MIKYAFENKFLRYLVGAPGYGALICGWLFACTVLVLWDYKAAIELLKDNKLDDEDSHKIPFWVGLFLWILFATVVAFGG